MVAHQGARRLRACILAVIPGDVIETAVQQCETTMKAKADTSPEAMQKLATAFGAYGVTKEQIEKRIQRRLDAIQPAQVVSLRKIYASLRDGMSSPADWFEPSAENPKDQGSALSASDKVKAAIKKRRDPAQPPAAELAPDPETGEIPQPPQQAPEEPGEAMAVTWAHVVEQILAAQNTDALDAARDLIQYVKGEKPQAELHQKASERLAYLQRENEGGR